MKKKREVRRCAGCGNTGHNIRTCGKQSTYVSGYTARSMAYQKRNRVLGFCALCSRTALCARVYDPDTGLILSDRLLAFCAKHWNRLQRNNTYPPPESPDIEPSNPTGTATASTRGGGTTDNAQTTKV